MVSPLKNHQPRGSPTWIPTPEAKIAAPDAKGDPKSLVAVDQNHHVGAIRTPISRCFTADRSNMIELVMLVGLLTTENPLK